MASSGINVMGDGFPNLVRENVEWDNNPYTVLTNFACRLKGEELEQASQFLCLMIFVNILVKSQDKVFPNRMILVCIFYMNIYLRHSGKE